MNKAAHAVLIGVNSCEDPEIPHLRYAEKDCLDLKRVLTDLTIGDFPPENTTLITGRDATTRAAKRALISEVVGRSEDEMVLVYFSGHGIVRELGGRRRTYLGTYDTSIADISAFPHEGLDMEFLHGEVFLASRANVVLFILDCCHSGAIVPSTHRDAARQIQFVRPGFPRQVYESVSSVFPQSGKGRIALVACPEDSHSRESEGLENGIFTYWILRGLRGEALDGELGEVTVDSLTTYLRSKVPADQPAGRYGQDFGRIALTHPKRMPGVISPIVIPSLSRKALPAPASVRPSYLAHPLEKCQSFIEKCLEQLSDEDLSSEQASVRLLEAITKTTGAELSFLLRRQNDNIVLGERSPTAVASEIFGQIAELIPLDYFREHSSRRSNHGFSVNYRLGKGASKCLIAVPTSFEPGSDFLAVCGLTPRHAQLTDEFGTALSAIFSAFHHSQEKTKAFLEARILDDLKRVWGFLPTEMYTRRLRLFRDRLARMTVYFQPVIYLLRNEVTIDSWEALARDPTTGSTPVDLFETAEAWGGVFMSELDRHFLFEEAQKFSGARRRLGLGPTLELSINVYPKSLMGDKYYNAMQELLASGIVAPQKLVLEISEKVSLHDLVPQAESEQTNVALFRKRLEMFVKEFQIGFAIDDFGIRQASVSNLAWLRPEIVKIDRDALLHEHSSPIIRFVVDLTRAGRLRHTRVVVEGFDIDSRITLAQIYGLGVRHVQGFSVGMPASDLYQLDEAKVAEILRSIAVDGENPFAAA